MDYEKLKESIFESLIISHGDGTFSIPSEDIDIAKDTTSFLAYNKRLVNLIVDAIIAYDKFKTTD